MPTFDTPDPIAATIELSVGNVRITASERTDTVVEVRPSDDTDESDVKAAAQVRIEYANGVLLVKAPKVRGLGAWTNKTRSVDVTIELPTGSRVHGTAAAGDFQCLGEYGECRLKSSTGHVRIERSGPLWVHTIGHVTVDRVAGNAEITTGSGKLHIGRVDGTATVKNSNGDTDIGEVIGELRVRAANGDIVVDRPVAGVDAKTANGNVRIDHAVRGSLVAESGCGDVAVNIVAGTAARLDLHTGYGRVHNSLTASDGPEPSEETVTVRANTSYGDIAIGRS